MPDSSINGTILCRCRDEHGEITVSEEGNERTLSFGGVAQSTIRTDRPELLLEDYNQAMMAALLFQKEPRSALMIGLGGCSLVHFLLKAAPDCALDVVEIRKHVIDLSREYFFLPAQNANVRIVHAECGKFLNARSADSPKYDLIIVDAFDSAGPAASLQESGFLSSCREELSESGVFVMNAWNSPEHRFPVLYQTVQAAFENNTLKLLLSESYRNAVIFGFRDPASCYDLPAHRSQAEELKERFGINFPRLLKLLHWQNFDEQDQ